MEKSVLKWFFFLAWLFCLLLFPLVSVPLRRVEGMQGWLFLVCGGLLSGGLYGVTAPLVLRFVGQSDRGYVKIWVKLALSIGLAGVTALVYFAALAMAKVQVEVKPLFYTVMACHVPLAMLAFHWFEDWTRHQKEKAQLEAQKNMAEMAIQALRESKEEPAEAECSAADVTTLVQRRLLQSQLSPHVLYNSLNNIIGLNEYDHEKANECLESLCHLLRNLNKSMGVETFTLEEERDIVESYLRIESIRLMDRLQVEWRWDVGLEYIEIPPLTLQSLAESAIQHALAPAIAGGKLLFILKRVEQGIYLSVANTGLPYGGADSQAGERGFSLLAERLDRHCSGKATFSVVQEAEWTRVEILLPDKPHEIPLGQALGIVTGEAACGSSAWPQYLSPCP